MEKPAAGEQAAATAPAEEPEVVETFQYQYPSIELFEKSAEEGDPGAQDELDVYKRQTMNCPMRWWKSTTAGPAGNSSSSI